MQINDFIKSATIDNFLKIWSESSQMAVVVVDNDGKLISSEIGFSDLCKRYSKKNNNMKEYFEFGDMLSFTYDIKIDETTIGKVICGQVFSDEPDLEKYRSLASKLDEDEEMFIRAVKKVAVCPEKTIQALASFLEKSINLLVNNEYMSKQQVELFEVIENEADKTVDLIKELNENSSGLSKIENKQNILSLNATIEAARAGEAGKGFTVVADEVRKLANNSMQINQSIKKNILELSKAIEMIDKARNMNIQA